MREVGVAQGDETLRFGISRSGTVTRVPAG